jgi:hypothetical protein
MEFPKEMPAERSRPNGSIGTKVYGGYRGKARQFRVKFREWKQNKRAFVHPRVRHGETGGVNAQQGVRDRRGGCGSCGGCARWSGFVCAPNQNVEVKDARSKANLAGAVSTTLAFDFQKRCKERIRRQLGADFRNRIEVRTLPRRPDRRGLMN